MAARWSLQGKTVLVTGAARGIGAEVARQASARGARVACVGLEPEELARVARACGDPELALEADVTDLESLERAVAATVERTGGIDVVVANAGIAPAAPLRLIEPEAFERTLAVNVGGVFKTHRACLPHVVERRGYMLTVASLAALNPYFPGFGAYSASKAGAEALTTVLRNEVRHLGVDAGVAYLSWIHTDLVHGGEAEHPAFAFLRSRLTGPVAKTHPVSVAGAAIIRGIERRARYVDVPRWVGAVRALRGLLPGAIEKQVAASAPEAMALYEAEYQRLGAEASKGAGAGGGADLQASRS